MIGRLDAAHLLEVPAYLLITNYLPNYLVINNQTTSFGSAPSDPNLPISTLPLTGTS
jgi:hypothetical protein